MKDKIREYFRSHRQEFIDDIGSLVAIPSVRGEAQEGKPFGEAPYAALEKALTLAKNFCFAVKNYDGYVGTADYNEKDTELNILAHLDVVAAGGGWHSDPFKMIEKDGVLFGRGVSDDKGPALAALYAMRALKELGVELNKNVRLILGTDEECGSSDLKYYYSKEKPAPWSFTPDAEFPVTNGEKGRFSKNFYGNFDNGNAVRYVESVNGGKVGNAVPSVCEAVVCGICDDELRRYADEAEKSTCAAFEIADGRIICTGKSAHGSLPFLGNNPITAMLQFLSSLSLDECDGTEKIRSLSALFPHGDFYGKALEVSMEDKLGKLTLTLDILNFENGTIQGYFDTRTPMKANQENCGFVIESKLNSRGFTLENNLVGASHYVDEDSPFIKILLKNYEDVTEDKGECVSMGGGTYVHNVEGGVAFGAIKKGVLTNMHGADEFMPVDDLIDAAVIFAGVIYDMCR